MRTNGLVHLPVLLLAAFVMFCTGCTKETDAPACQAEVEPEQQPKDNELKFLYATNGTGTFAVLRWNPSCADGYGTITTNPAFAHNYHIQNTTPAYLRVLSGTSPDGNGYCRLQMGNNAGDFDTWGPWYHIWPQFGPPANVRKGLKIRVKRVFMGFQPPDLYNRGLQYNATANTWLIDGAVASGLFEVAIVTGIPTALCTPR